MIIYFLAYFLTVIIVFLVQRIRRLKVEDYPALKMEQGGIVFYSTKKHRLKIYNAKIMQVGNSVYVKKENKTIQLLNVDNVFVEKDYLYFKANGKVKLVFECEKLYRYFNLKIRSDKIDIKKFKKLALLDVINHIFDYKNAIFLKKYLKIVKNLLNINIEKEKITIKQNKFKIPFSVTYLSNGVKKCVKVNCKKKQFF